MEHATRWSGMQRRLQRATYNHNSDFEWADVIEECVGCKRGSGEGSQEVWQCRSCLVLLDGQRRMRCRVVEVWLVPSLVTLCM